MERIRAFVGLTLLVLMIIVALVLIVRRLSGALVQPLPGVVMLSVSVAIVSIILIYRAALPRAEYSVLCTPYSDRGWQGLLLHFAVPAFAAVTILGSLSIAGTPILGLLVAWLLLFAAESWLWLAHVRPNMRIVRPRSSIISRNETEVETEEAEIPQGLVQQLTRTIDGDRESIHALIGAEIVKDDRLAVLHVAFCPPLAERPELTAHALDADGAEIRITQAETFGARIEVRLSKNQAAPRTVTVELFGSATAPKSS